MNDSEYVHVEWVQKVSTRKQKVGLNDDGTPKLETHRRSCRCSRPKTGDFVAYMAELAENAPAEYLRVGKALRVGTPLVAQKGLWPDSGGKISDAKVNATFIAAVIAKDEEIVELVANDETPAAMALVRERLATPFTVGQDIDEPAAKAIEASYKAGWDEVEVLAGQYVADATAMHQPTTE